MMPHHWRPLAHEQNSISKCKQHTCTLHDKSTYIVHVNPYRLCQCSIHVHVIPNGGINHPVYILKRSEKLCYFQGHHYFYVERCVRCIHFPGWVCRTVHCDWSGHHKSRWDLVRPVRHFLQGSLQSGLFHLAVRQHDLGALDGETYAT